MSNKYTSRRGQDELTEFERMSLHGPTDMEHDRRYISKKIRDNSRKRKKSKLQEEDYGDDIEPTPKIKKVRRQSVGRRKKEDHGLQKDLAKPAARVKPRYKEPGQIGLQKSRKTGSEELKLPSGLSKKSEPKNPTMIIAPNERPVPTSSKKLSKKSEKDKTEKIKRTKTRNSGKKESQSTPKTQRKESDNSSHVLTGPVTQPCHSQTPATEPTLEFGEPVTVETGKIDRPKYSLSLTAIRRQIETEKSEDNQLPSVIEKDRQKEVTLENWTPHLLINQESSKKPQSVNETIEISDSEDESDDEVQFISVLKEPSVALLARVKPNNACMSENQPLAPIEINELGETLYYGQSIDDF